MVDGSASLSLMRQRWCQHNANIDKHQRWHRVHEISRFNLNIKFNYERHGRLHRWKFENNYFCVTSYRRVENPFNNSLRCIRWKHLFCLCLFIASDDRTTTSGAYYFCLIENYSSRFIVDPVEKHISFLLRFTFSDNVSAQKAVGKSCNTWYKYERKTKQTE